MSEKQSVHPKPYWNGDERIYKMSVFNKAVDYLVFNPCWGEALPSCVACGATLPPGSTSCTICGGGKVLYHCRFCVGKKNGKRIGFLKDGTCKHADVHSTFFTRFLRVFYASFMRFLRASYAS